MLYSDPVAYINGLTIYRDFSNPEVYYFLPPERPRVARLNDSGDSGPYALRLVLYRPDPDSSPPQGMEDGGGFLNLDCDLKVTEDQIEDTREKLRSQISGGDNIRLVPVPFTEGTVELVLLGVGREQGGDEASTPQAFVRKVAGSAVPSLYGSQRAAFSVILDRHGAALMRQVLAEGGMTMALAIYHLKYAAIGPAYNLEITIDYERCQNTMDLSLNASIGSGSSSATRNANNTETKSNSTITGRAGFHMMIDRLKETGAIEVKVVDPVPGEDSRSPNQEQINELIGKLMGQEWFKPTLAPQNQLTNQLSNLNTPTPSTPTPTTPTPTTPTTPTTPSSTSTTHQAVRLNPITPVPTANKSSHTVTIPTPATSGNRETVRITPRPTSVVLTNPAHTEPANWPANAPHVDVQLDVEGGNDKKRNITVQWPAPSGTTTTAQGEETLFMLFFAYDDPSDEAEVTAYVNNTAPATNDDRFNNHSRGQTATTSTRGRAALAEWLATLDPNNRTVTIDAHASFEGTDDADARTRNTALSGRRAAVARRLLEGQTTNRPTIGAVNSHGISHSKNYATNPNAVPTISGDPGLQADRPNNTHSRPAHRVAILKGRKPPAQRSSTSTIQYVGELSRNATTSGTTGTTNTPEASTPTGGGQTNTNSSLQVGFEVDFEMIDRQEKKTVSYKLNERKARIHEIHPQGQLAFDVRNPEDYIIETSGNDVFFQKLKISATTTATWELDGIDTIQVQIRYADEQPKEIKLTQDSPTDSVTYNVVYQDGDDTRGGIYEYRYKVTIHYRQGVALGDQSGAMDSIGAPAADEDGWIRSMARNLVIHPRDVTPAVTVNVATGLIHYDLLERAQVVLTYGPYRQNLILSADTPDHRMVIRPEPGLEDPQLHTEGLLFYRDGAQVPLSKASWMPQELVVINEPRENSLRVKVILADPNGEYEKVQVRLRYEHANRVVEHDIEMDHHAQIEDWRVRLEDPEQRAWQYQATIIEKSGAIETTDWIDGEGDKLILGVQAEEVVTINFNLLMVPPMAELAAIKIDLAYDDERLDVHWQHTELVRPGHPGSFSWAIALKDETVRNYRYKVTEYSMTGGVKEGPWVEADSRSTVVMLLPLA